MYTHTQNTRTHTHTHRQMAIHAALVNTFDLYAAGDP